MRAARLLDERGRAHRRGAEHDERRAAREHGLDRRAVADAAADLDRHRRRARRSRATSACCARLAERAVEIDDVQPIRAVARELARRARPAGRGTRSRGRAGPPRAAPRGRRADRSRDSSFTRPPRTSRSSASPTRLALLGVELAREHVVACGPPRRTARRASASSATTRRIRRHGAIRVHEVDVRAVGDARAAARRAARPGSSPCAGPSARGSPGGSRVDAPAQHAEAGDSRPPRCARTAPAARGRCRGTACRARSPRAAPRRGRARASPRMNTPNAPWPGTTILSARRTTSGSRVTTTSPPTCASARSTERRLPRAHVDDRDHAGQRALRRRHRAAEPRVDPRRRVARARERLEDALDHVVRVAAVVQHDVQVALRARRERGEELLRELAVEVADPLALEALRRFHTNAGRPQKSTATVDEHLVHRQRRRAVAHDAGAVAERLLERVAEHEPDVLDGVVAVDLDVAGAPRRSRSNTPCRANASSMCVRNGTGVVDRARARAVELELDADLRLLRVALDPSRVAPRLLVSAPLPIVQRSHGRHRRARRLRRCSRSPRVAAARRRSPSNSRSRRRRCASRRRRPRPRRIARAKRHAAALAIVPEGTHVPAGRAQGRRRAALELAAVGSATRSCARSTPTRRACSAPSAAGRSTSTRRRARVPGRRRRCPATHRRQARRRAARGASACRRTRRLPADKVAHMSWNLDGTKVAVLVGDDVHLFDAASKAHAVERSRSAATRASPNDRSRSTSSATTIFVEGADQGPYSAVWAFKADGTPVGPITGIGGKDEKPISTTTGLVLAARQEPRRARRAGLPTRHELRDRRPASAQARAQARQARRASPTSSTRSGRTATRSPTSARTRSTKAFGPLIGATAVAGQQEPARAAARRPPRRARVLDPKTLAEKKAIKLPWCERRRGAARRRRWRRRAAKARRPRRRRRDAEDRRRPRRRRPAIPTTAASIASAAAAACARARRRHLLRHRADEIERRALLACRSARRARGPAGCPTRRA